MNVFRLKNYTMESSRSRPYLCKLCGRKVHTISALQQHTRIHRSIFPYQCSVCSKSFRLLTQLKGHQRLHDHEKPLMCGWCDEQFLEQYQLGQHLLRKHNITASCIGTKLVVASPESLATQTYNMATGEHTLVIKKRDCALVDDDCKIVAEVNHEVQASEDSQPLTQGLSASNMEPEVNDASVMLNGVDGSPLDNDLTVNENAAQSEVKSTRRAKRQLTVEEPYSLESVLDEVDGACQGESKEVNEIESFIDMNGNAMADDELHDQESITMIESDTDAILNADVTPEAVTDMIVTIEGVSDQENTPNRGDEAEVNEAIMLLTGLQDVSGESSQDKEAAAGGETLGEEPGFSLAMMTDDDSRSLTITSDPTHHVLRGDPSLHVCPSRDDLFSFDETVAFTEDAENTERAKPPSSELSVLGPVWSSSCGNLAGLMLSGTPQKLSVDPGAASVTASPAMSPFRATIGQGGSDSEDSDTEMGESRQNVEPLASMGESGEQGAQGPVTADKESSISPGHTEASNDLPIQPNAINFIKTDGMSPFPNLKSFSGQEQLQKSTLDELKSLTDNVRKCTEDDLYKGFISLPKSLPTNMKLVNGVFCRTDSTPLPNLIIPEKTVNPKIKHVNEKKTDSTPRPTSPIIPVTQEITEKSEIQRVNEKKTETAPWPTSPIISVTPEITEKCLNEMKTEPTPQLTSPLIPVIVEITKEPEIQHLNEMKREKSKVVKIVVEAETASRRLRAKSDPLPHKRKRKRVHLDDDFVYDFEESPPKKPQAQGYKPGRQFSDIFQDFIFNEKPDEEPDDSSPPSPPPSPPPVKRQRIGRRSAIVLDTSASETDAHITPKRRGRPPKSLKPVENGDVKPDIQKIEKDSIPKQTPAPYNNSSRRPHRANAGKRRHSVKWNDTYDESDTTDVSESDASSKHIGSKDSNSGDNAAEYNLRPKRRKNFQFLQDDAIFECECCTNSDKKHKTLNIPHYVEHIEKVYELRVLIGRLIRTVFPDLSYPNLFREGGLAVEYLMDEIMGACTEEHRKKKLGTPFGTVNNNVKVVLCKYPQGCLRHLRRKAVRLLDSLLPGIQEEGLEPLEINSLIEQVIETNQNAGAVDQPGDEL